MTEKGNTLSRNPNICASCSSMADGMDETGAPDSACMEPYQELTSELAEANARDRLARNPTELDAHHGPVLAQPDNAVRWGAPRLPSLLGWPSNSSTADKAG